MRLVLHGYKISRSPYLCTKILKVYIEIRIGFSHICNPDVLNKTLLSQGCIFEMSPSMRTVGGIYIPNDRDEVRSL